MSEIAKRQATEMSDINNEHANNMQASNKKLKHSDMQSPVTVILGEAWGDEGKGKLIDDLAQEADVICRFAGGANAGHTVVVGGKTFKFHLLPSGILNPKAVSVIGNGVALNILSLLKEIKDVESNGETGVLERVLISDRCHLVFGFHMASDGILEDIRKRNGENIIGTTKQGIGPCYAAKANRRGVRAVQFAGDWADFVEAYNKAYNEEAIRISAKGTSEDLAKLCEIKDQELPLLKDAVEKIKPRIADTIVYLNKQLCTGKQILVEGANAALIDLDFGTYPYVTSSSCTVGGVCTGLGIPASRIGDVIGIMKAYTTRVGGGPFPTEIHGGIGEFLQEKGHEFGSTTGRRRRCGWMDVVVAKYSNMINGYTCFNLTKLDILTGLEEVKIGVAYRYNGKELESMPADIKVLEKVEVEYETMPGWTEDISEIREYEKLPLNARKYIERIEELTGVPIKYIGVGSGRDATIVRP